VSDIAVRVLWACCLAFGATVCGVGLELHATGAEPWLSVPVVVAGILLLPLTSAVLTRLGEVPVRPPQ
jgi:hypothetical protein